MFTKTSTYLVFQAWSNIMIDEEVYVGKHRVGRFPIDPDLGSPGNFDIARTWLKTCQEKHTTCWEKHGIYQRMAKLPTRVIDVGPNEESGILRIICPRGESGQYVTLSHCWGGEITPLLTEHTIKDFQQSLLFDDLPANFRDAIIVTRQLGIRYLWIDSLCILQDSKTDWEAESKKMGLYYGQSTLTVLAQCSESSTQGFLKSWVDIWKKTNPIKLDVASGGNDNRQVTVEWLPYEREDILFLKENDSPLASRGWTLQEDLLSPRKLYYGKQQIHWKCYETTTSAEGVPSRNYELLDQVNSPRGLPFDYKVVSSVLKDGPLSEARRHPVDTEDLLREYYDLLHMYSMRQFTKESDRLPAFSGLAQQIHKCLEGEYLAGIWSCDPDRGLHWCRYRDDMEAAGGLDAGEQRGLRTSKQRRKLCAPSWSWASASRPIKFDVSPHTPNSFQLELLSYHMEYQDQSNPYGQVKAGRLSVRGYTIPVVEKTQVPLMMYCGSIDFDDPGTDKFGKPCIAQARLYRVENEDNEVASFAVQKVLGDESKEGDNVVSPPQEHILLALGVKGISQGVMLTKMGCILLRKITTREDDLFERIGFISLSVINLDTHMSDWSQRELTII